MRKVWGNGIFENDADYSQGLSLEGGVENGHEVGPLAVTHMLTLSHPVTDTRMSDEIVHNLDGCEISLVGDDLDPERESLLLDMASLQQRGLELTNTSAYLTIAGQWGLRACLLFLCAPLPMIKSLGISGGPPSRPRDVTKCHLAPCQPGSSSGFQTATRGTVLGFGLPSGSFSLLLSIPWLPCSWFHSFCGSVFPNELLIF